MKITIFTPTYNRADKLPTLYLSLQNQTCRDFEWLIVDDGSSDNTEDIVQSWIIEQKCNLRYFRQENGGKHRAINNGVQLAKGEIFFIVDSDDYLKENAVERVLFHYNAIKDDNTFCGVVGLRATPDGKRIGGECDFGILDCSYTDFRSRLRIVGDTAEAFKTSILKKYPFPEIEGEKFCTEALVWDRLSLKYKFRYFYEKIYVCEYLEGGLTSTMTRIRMKSPKYATLYYSERFRLKLPITEKVKAAINYWRFAFCDKNSNGDHLKSIGWGCLLMPLGYLYHLKDSRLK